MKTAGIVAEYNPFHTGHAHHISRTRELLGEDCAVVCVMSGSWTQGARPAIADKWLRARMALQGGADLVLELPVPFALSSAEQFAHGAVSLLHATGVVDVLSFGSELGSIRPLSALANCLNSPEFDLVLRDKLSSGASFAACRQRAAESLLGRETAALLSSPNNILGIEYLRALARLDSPISPLTVRREGAGYHELAQDRPVFRSATDLRRLILEGNWADAGAYLLPENAALLQAAPLPTADLERTLLACLRKMEEEDWAALPDSGAGEGLPRRLTRAGHEAVSMEEFYALAKTKRYSHARLRRLVLWAWLGMTAADRPHSPAYLRVLGSNETGRALLKEMKKKSSLPILTKPAHARRLDEAALRQFRLECRATDLYALCFDPISPAGADWRTSPVLL